MNKESRSAQQLIMNRFYMIAISLFIFALFLIGKLIYIQFYENDLGLGLEPDALVKNIVLVNCHACELKNDACNFAVQAG